MLSHLPFFPPQGSTHAASVDALYLFFIAVTAFFSVLIALLIVVFAVRFRRRTPDEVGAPIHGSLVLELTWTFIPLVIAMVMFVWGASLYFQITTPPSNAMEIYVVGKRWMWKAQHVSGQREINELHVPVGQPVKLIIGSEDVLHAYWVPAFRMKMDAVPGRTTTMWFEAAKPGEYQLFCAEYCGMSHSRMIGKVTAMEPGAFQTWLAGGKRHRLDGRDGRQGLHRSRLRHLPRGCGEAAARPCAASSGRRSRWPTARRSPPTRPTSASRS